MEVTDPMTDTTQEDVRLATTLYTPFGYIALVDEGVTYSLIFQVGDSGGVKVNLGAKNRPLTDRDRVLSDIAWNLHAPILAAELTAYQSLGSPEYLAALVTAVGECVERGLVFGYHPGFHHAESDPRRDVYVPQETGWWVRDMGDDGAGVESHPTLAEALAAHDNAERLREEAESHD
jgi:hypothetical protein